MRANLKKYPQIIDILFYMSEYKSFNIPLFNELITLFNSFVKLYENCLVDVTLINNSFIHLRNIELEIYNVLNSFIFSIPNINYSNKLLEIKKKTTKVLNKLLNNLVIIHKKLIYYNGYNINTKSIQLISSNVLPFNMYNDLENIKI
jgi:hypothetical protein